MIKNLKKQTNKKTFVYNVMKDFLAIKITHGKNIPSVELHFFSTLRFLKTMALKTITGFKGE